MLVARAVTAVVEGHAPVVPADEVGQMRRLIGHILPVVVAQKHPVPVGCLICGGRLNIAVVDASRKGDGVRPGSVQALTGLNIQTVPCAETVIESVVRVILYGRVVDVVFPADVREGLFHGRVRRGEPESRLTERIEVAGIAVIDLSHLGGFVGSVGIQLGVVLGRPVDEICLFFLIPHRFRGIGVAGAGEIALDQAGFSPVCQIIGFPDDQIPVAVHAVEAVASESRALPLRQGVADSVQVGRHHVEFVSVGGADNVRVPHAHIAHGGPQNRFGILPSSNGMDVDVLPLQSVLTQAEVDLLGGYAVLIPVIVLRVAYKQIMITLRRFLRHGRHLQGKGPGKCAAFVFQLCRQRHVLRRFAGCRPGHHAAVIERTVR